ncbi:MAG: PQQ-binding-like beta-propeller repeat protein [Verrucomicrobiales bacterium]|nr:PQQ-binding-like beta-propeller repeat protein [Verrucomicrobiales bacterium]
MYRYFLVVVSGLAFAASRSSVAEAIEDWSQFRGPNASGTLKGARPPERFGPEDHLLWRIKVPWSPSSPVISGGQIFLTTFHQGELQTRSYDRKTGELNWSKGIKPEQLEEFANQDGSPAASTPAAQAHRVVSYFGSFGLVCHDFDGKELWRLPLPVALSGGSYGSGTSPIIVGKHVFLNRDLDRNSSVMAVDLDTGRKVWETSRPEASGGFSTPVYWKNNRVDELVVAGTSTVKGYDLSNGAQRWVVNGVSWFVCTTPVVGHDHVYFGCWSPGKPDSGLPLDWESFRARFDKNSDGKVDANDFDKVGWEYTRGLDRDHDGAISETDLGVIRNQNARGENTFIAISAGGRGDITETHVAWKFGRGLPYVPSPVLYDGRIYYVKDGGMLSSLDAQTGKPHYFQERLNAEGNYYASPVAANDRIYVASLPGKLSVIKAGGEKPTLLHQVEFGERILATPAMCENNLYLRTQEHLFAFGSDEVRR